MEPTTTNTRRQFLRNTALASLAVTAAPALAKTTSPPHRYKINVECDRTTLDYYGQGPFYTANPPMIINNQLAGPNEPGTRLIVSGVVRTLDCSEVIPDALIDIWHANDAGQYDTVGYNLRGTIRTNEQGFYLFETILPGKYLNGPSFRPRHIHFKITSPGFSTLTTQLYFEGDDSIPGDAAASITSGTYNASARIIPITLNADGKYEGTWDIIVNGDGVTGVSDLHLEKGILYETAPNPFRDLLRIRYGVFQQARTKIEVFNLQGSRVAVLDEQSLSPEKYEATWQPDGSIPSGVYFITLKINDLQVHYLKVVKE
ncbi:MAG TPA: T9SS type A sorting domain-containing protein [Saprospiraceae bacterium]|nr:T9SS type A sorting domain-containing protein [Saprospiraceae bacterium]HPI06895.1 T9SS type A sorting domain-containing protein [Saprospiraceae bacterium]